jgi:hypothetical protein
MIDKWTGTDHRNSTCDMNPPWYERRTTNFFYSGFSITLVMKKNYSAFCTIRGDLDTSEMPPSTKCLSLAFYVFFDAIPVSLGKLFG